MVSQSPIWDAKKQGCEIFQLSAPRGYEQSSINLAALLGDSGLTPAALALQKELARKVEDAISLLDEKDAEIIIMRHYENLTNQEISQILHLTEPAARMRYLRAIRRLSRRNAGQTFQVGSRNCD